jgi:YD repeat-containing protein
MDEDTTAKRQRQMIDGKRGSKLVSGFSEEGNITITYNPDNSIDTVTIQKVSDDGTVIQKVMTFGYDGAGNLISKSDVITYP